MISQTGTKRLNVLLLAHDLSDPAIAKRVQLFQAGGATVSAAGFRRTAEPGAAFRDCPVTDMGRTRNGGFAQRALMVLRTLAHLKRHNALFAAADVIVARNLEMLAIAVAGSRRAPHRPVVIYEVLDIHRLLLGKGLVSRALRWIERRLLRHAQAIFTSSPAFITQYFHKLNPTVLPIRLLENKPLPLAPVGKQMVARPAQPPWIIGWFGMIRCKKSLHILAETVRRNPGLVEVVIRGRVALDQMPDFHAIVAATPGLRFEGPYKHPDDLAAIYGAVHFSWVIDMYEEGLNSSWLLPNRLYEGGAYNAVPIAIADVEIGHYLKRLDIGVLLQNPLQASLEAFLRGLTLDAYGHLADAARAIPSSQWVFDNEDCKTLVRFMEELNLAFKAAYGW